MMKIRGVSTMAHWRFRRKYLKPLTIPHRGTAERAALRLPTAIPKFTSGIATFSLSTHLLTLGLPVQRVTQQNIMTGFGLRGTEREALSAARFPDPISIFRPMKTTRCLFGSVLGSLLVFGGVGCHKNVTAGQPQTLQEGVARLQAALASANPEVQSILYHGVFYSIRYGDYAHASLALQQIAGDSSLNNQQELAVSNLTDLLK